VSEPPLPRVRVTSPRATATRRRRVTGASEIDAQTDLGEVYMSSLVRSQLRLALLVLAALAVLVAGLPLLFTVAPALVDVHVVGVPLPWLLLAAGVYPVLLLLGWLYVRAAERNERDFAEVVERR
jgi:putative solute:sodium symporter small subunit